MQPFGQYARDPKAARAAFWQGFFILVQPRAAPSARRQGFPDSLMLPNLRLLITATLSTFLLTAAAGLFVSLRLGHEPLTMRGDARAAFDENPINRISLSWSRPEQDRAAALRELPLPADAPAPGRDEQSTPAIDAPPKPAPESGVAEPAQPQPQLASRSEEVAQPQIAPAPPIEELQIASRAAPGPQPTTLSGPGEMPGINSGDQSAPAPEVTGAIGEPAQSIPAAGAGTKLANSPRNTSPQAHKAKSKKRVTQRKRAGAHRIASRQFLQLTPRAAAKINTAAPFLFFGPPSLP